MTNGRTYLQTDFNAFCDNPQGSSEYSRSADRQLGRLDMSQAAFLFSNDTPPRHSYHSRRVIARSGSGSRQTTSREPLAQATSGSLTTWIPCNNGRVGVRATSSERTYRRSEVESDSSYELRKNRGSKLKRPAEGKSCSVSESRKNSNRREELNLIEHKRLCVKCRVNEVYLDIKTMDWCEECLWKFLQEDEVC